MRKLPNLALALVLTSGCAVLWVNGFVGGSEALQSTRPQPKETPTQADKARDEKAILEAIFDYQEAFNRADAAGVAKHFTEQAELVDESGETIHGRDAIRKEYEAFFKRNPGAKVDVAVDWFRWVSPDVIIGHGKARISPKAGAATSASYTAVHTKKDGKWQVVMIRESLALTREVKTHEQKMQDLDWLVGEWVDNDDSGTLKIHGKWSRNKAYLTRTFTVTTKAGVDLEGTEIIAWDASRNGLRSWVFDSNGGFAEGYWQHKGKSWYCRLSGMQADGKKSSAVHILTPQDDHYTFQSISRTLDGEIQPDIDNVKVRRVSKGDKDK